MFGCVYCFEDHSLCVVEEDSAKLQLLGANPSFSVKQSVRVVWTKKQMYTGIIVKIGDDEEDLTEFARKATQTFLKKGEKFLDVPDDLYTFNHKEVIKQKRAVVQTEKIKCLQEETQLSVQKKKNGKKTKKEETAGKTKRGKKEKTKEQNHLKKNNAVLKKNLQKKAFDDTNRIIHEQMMELSDLAVQFDAASENTCSHSTVQMSSPSQSKSMAEHTTNCTSDSQNKKQSLNTQQSSATTLTATWSLCTSETARPNSPSRASIQNIPAPPPVILDFMKILCNSEVQEYARKFVEFYDRPTPTRTFLRNEMQTSAFQKTQILPYPEWPGDHGDKNGESQPNYTNWLSEESDIHMPQYSYGPQTDNSSDRFQPPPYSTQPNLQFNTSSQLQQMSSTSEPIPFQPCQTSAPMQQDSQPIQMSPLPTLSHATCKTPAPMQQDSQPIQMSPLPTLSHATCKTPAPMQQDSQPIQMSPLPTLSYATCKTPAPMQQDSQPIQMSPLPTLSHAIRRSPRKHKTTLDNQDNCKLLETSELVVNRSKLRKATAAASRYEGGKAAFTLTSKLAALIFSTEELAQSRGQGIREAKKGDIRPVLNPTKVEVIKEYVNTWCVRNGKGKLEERYFNDAITEKISYSRKLLKKLQKD